MSKLNLNKINFAGAKTLSREELRKVMGGSPGNGGYTGDRTFCNGMTASECIDVRSGEIPYIFIENEQELQIELRSIETLCNYFCSDTRPI